MAHDGGHPPSDQSRYAPESESLKRKQIKDLNLESELSKKISNPNPSTEKRSLTELLPK